MIQSVFRFLNPVRRIALCPQFPDTRQCDLCGTAAAVIADYRTGRSCPSEVCTWKARETRADGDQYCRNPVAFMAAGGVADDTATADLVRENSNAA